MAINNFFSFFSSGTKNREIQETRASWERVERQWRASPLAAIDIEVLARDIVQEAMSGAERMPATPIIAALCEATEELLRTESITALTALWPVIETNIEAAIEFREMLTRRSSWATQYQRMRDVASRRLAGAYCEFVKALPEVCFSDWGAGNNETFDVPLIDLLDNPAEVIERFIQFPFTDDALTLNLFSVLRAALRQNIFTASGNDPEAVGKREPRVIPPTAQHGKSARELADLYVVGTPFATLLELFIPFEVTDEVRFEHCHIIGGTGHGKTQLLQKMIYTDLVASQYDRRSVVVIDSQGDLIQKLSRLELFSPYVGNGLGERLVLLDPSDVTHPVALNLFDAHLDRLRDYDPADRERIQNGVVELYETFFDALLGAELTQRQDVIFRYLARLMLTIPGATIETLMQLMENGRAFKPYMDKLEGASKRFFETEFFSPSFSATKSQILKRLWGVLSTPAFERMFSQKENKLDLFDALNGGKIILVNTAKDLLKDEGSRLFGRFFIAMLSQAVLERSTVPEGKRTPTFVYVDEAHEYFDDRIEAILNQARKYKVGLTLSHQNLDQLSMRLRATLLTNTSVKCVGGVSARDSRALADELHTTPEFIDGMHRRGPKTEFAVWVKHQTPHAIRLSVPLGFLERQHTLDEDDYEELLKRNRERYCGTLGAVLPAPIPQASEIDEPRIAASLEDMMVAPREEQQRQQERARDEPIMSPPQLPRITQPEKEESRSDEVGLGKGGPKHRYIQKLVKELGEQVGFRATLEAPLVGGGQVDVLLERGDVSVAIEISVTTSPEYEQEKMHRCLQGGYAKVALVIAKSKAAFARNRTLLLEGLSDAERGRVAILSPGDIPDYIAALAPPPEPTETIVKGYRVRVSHVAASPEEAKARREALARVIAKSIGEQEKG